MPPPPQPAPHILPGTVKPATQAPVAPATSIDFDATMTLIEQAMPTQIFALEVLREVGHLLNPTPPPA